MEISCRERAEYIQIKAQGVPDPKAFREGLEDLRERAAKAGTTRILIDAKEVVAPKKEFHRYLFGESVAKLLGPPFKVAILYRAEWISGFAETTAVNRGANLLISSNEGEALEWLLGTPPAP